jgi:hypothetical protein
VKAKDSLELRRRQMEVAHTTKLNLLEERAEQHDRQAAARIAELEGETSAFRGREKTFKSQMLVCALRGRRLLHDYGGGAGGAGSSNDAAGLSAGLASEVESRRAVESALSDQLKANSALQGTVEDLLAQVRTITFSSSSSLFALN